MPLVKYNTVENRIVGRSAAGTLKAGGCNSFSYPSWSPDYVPNSTQFEYESLSINESRFDPSRGRSFSKEKRNGAILMSELVVESERIQRSHVSVLCIRRDAAFWAASCANPSLVCATALKPVTSSWTESFDFSRLSADNMNVPQVGALYQGLDDEIADAIVTTRQQAWSDAVNAYDLLTEMAEARETLSFLTSSLSSAADLMKRVRDKDPQTWNRYRKWAPKQLLHSADRAAQLLGKRWLASRYAVMPLIYSMQDIAGLLQTAKYRFQTDRSKKVIEMDTPEVLSDVYPIYMSFETRGSTTIRSTTKAAYNLGALQKLISRVGFNPFATAWELIPLSFVVDWFVNVGDSITALTSLDYASTRSGCTSVRLNFTDRTYCNIQRTGKITRNWTFPCGTESFSSNFNDNAKGVIIDRRLNSYRRTLWHKPSGQFVVDPFINWKRFIDGLALASNPTRKLLRSL